ncbi:Peptidase M15 [Burkholderia sp. GAS332]|nr:Peptidase M15 [Burkholderia sp. GAS332]
MMRLTDHFTLDELTQSETAARRGIANTPSPAIVESLTRTAQTLEQVRTLLGSCPVLVSSGYRSPALNAAVGGSATSAHVQGLAADFFCPGFGSPLDICRKIAASGIAFDQLIFEGTWVHLGLGVVGQKPRNQVLTAHFGGGVTRYDTGLQP